MVPQGWIGGREENLRPRRRASRLVGKGHVGAKSL